MKLKFIPLDYSRISINNKTYMRLYGKTDKGKTCCIIDKIKNHFYILTKKIKKFERELKQFEGVKKVEITEKNLLNKKVKAIKIYCNYKDMKDIAEKSKKIGKRKTYERDISLTTKYIINSKINPLKWYIVDGENIHNNELGGISNTINTDYLIKLNEIEESRGEFKPKVLAFDIESEELEIGKGKILMISLFSKNIKKVLTWKKCNKKNVECYKNEKEMIQGFKDYVKKINPDILTGYFSDGFDLPYLRKRARKNKIELRLGNYNSKIILSRGRPLKARIRGLVHIDLLKFIQTAYSQYLKSETLSLDEVANELLGERKKEFNHNRKTEDIKKKEWEEYFEYNLKDSELTYKLFEKIWPDLLEFTKVVQEPVDKICRYSLSRFVENYLLHNLDKYNEIAERLPTHNQIKKRRMKRTKGAFVLRPKAGLYKKLAIFDFTSMHTSIIVTYNISKGTLTNKKGYKSPKIKIKGKEKRFHFRKKPGFFPQLCKQIVELRKKYKKQYKKNPSPITKARSNAFKVLSASIHGYVGFFGARYYSFEASSSILAFVRKLNKETIKKVRENNFNVIYGDTDSVALTLNKKTRKETLSFLKKLNSELPGIMHLELEDFYKRGIWVTKRGGGFGAKKKYALIDYNDKLKIRGFETVRRDWCQLSRKVQNKVLEKILKTGKEKPALKYVRKIVKKLKNREIKKENLIIKTKLKKSLDEYKAKTPHVVIARKMKKQGTPIDPGKLIVYYIAESKKKNPLVRERAKLPDEDGKYDINYYLKKQILPAIENIFEIFGIGKEEILHGKKQTKLDGFK